MKYHAILPAAFALALGAAGLAQAQTAAPATQPAPQVATPAAPMSAPSAPTSPSMPASGTTPATNNAVNTQPQNNPGAPVAGANSFTQGEARRRIQKHGFTKVSALKPDQQGVWRGMAMHHGKSVRVSMDYQGNVVSQ